MTQEWLTCEMTKLQKMYKTVHFVCNYYRTRDENETLDTAYGCYYWVKSNIDVCFKMFEYMPLNVLRKNENDTRMRTANQTL